MASRHFEWLVGVDPAEAEPWWQDLMAKALYSERRAALAGLRPAALTATAPHAVAAEHNHRDDRVNS